jgi:hypothetical protein
MEEKGRLAGSGGPQDSESFAGANVERDAVEDRLVLLITEDQAFDRYPGAPTGIRHDKASLMATKGTSHVAAASRSLQRMRDRSESGKEPEKPRLAIAAWTFLDRSKPRRNRWAAVRPTTAILETLSGPGVRLSRALFIRTASSPRIPKKEPAMDRADPTAAGRPKERIAPVSRPILSVRTSRLRARIEA